MVLFNILGNALPKGYVHVHNWQAPAIWLAEETPCPYPIPDETSMKKWT